MGEDNMYKLAPSILNADYSNLGSQIRLADKAGADMILTLWMACLYHVFHLDGI